MWYLPTVINAIRLFFLLGVGFEILWGLGWLAVGPMLHNSLFQKKREIPLLQEIGLILVCGLILNFALVLCFQTLNISLVIGLILSLFGTGCYLFSTFRNHDWRKPALGSYLPFFGFAFVCLLFLGPILADPLNDWDARSMWFFHAKMIYAAGSIGISAGWQHPSASFSHVDYPNLIPALGAQAASVMGFWNEYLPKVSLFFMLVPPIALLFTFARRTFSYAIFLLLVPFGFSIWLWNGYMDGFLALYFSIAVLLLGRYLKSSQSIDLISSLACLFILLSVKNEGTLALIAGLGAIFLIGFIKRKSIRIAKIQPKFWIYLAAAVIALVPFILWTIDKSQWNLKNDLSIGSPESFSRIIQRINDGSYKAIFKAIFKQNEGPLLLLGTIFFASAARNIKFPRESLPALAAGSIYVLGMFIIYLLTPLEVGWHLNFSIDRTMLAVSGCIYVGSFYILQTVENHVRTELDQSQ